MEAKPNLKRFKIVFRGYDTDEVENYLKDIDKNTELITDQKERINELRSENTLLRNENEALKKDKELISDAIINAHKQADQIVAEARRLADEEIERVRIFREKWEFFAEKYLGELAPKQKMLYDKLSQRIDESIEKFSADSKIMGKKLDEASATTSQKLQDYQKEHNVQDNNEKDVHHAIELNEVYDTSESLTDLLNDLG